MIPAELEKLVIKHKEEGHLPFFVNCTTGTTVYGAYDPISEIAGRYPSVIIFMVFFMTLHKHTLAQYQPVKLSSLEEIYFSLSSWSW